MNLFQQTTALFLSAKKNVVLYSFKRGFLYSRKKGVSRETIAWLQQPIDLSPAGILRWLKKKQWDQLVADNSYVQDRHNILGPDLATAHFVVAHGGAVKFEGMDRWIKQTKSGKIYLPSSAQEDLKLEAVDASNTNMMYNSFDNFVDLYHLKYLNLSNCPHIDDWCLDRFVQFRNTVCALDLSGCPQVTERGLATLHKLRRLKRLFLYDLPNVKHKNIVAIMLEEAMPHCAIEGIDYTNGVGEGALDNASSRQPPAFLEQWEQFAHRRETNAIQAAAQDGVLELSKQPQKNTA